MHGLFGQRSPLVTGISLDFWTMSYFWLGVSWLDLTLCDLLELLMSCGMVAIGSEYHCIL